MFAYYCKNMQIVWTVANDSKYIENLVLCLKQKTSFS